MLTLRNAHLGTHIEVDLSMLLCLEGILCNRVIDETRRSVVDCRSGLRRAQALIGLD
jgi:hypothetical protein